MELVATLTTTPPAVLEKGIAGRMKTVRLFVCVDYQTLQDETATIRDRDLMDQKRLDVGELKTILKIHYFLNK